MRPSNVGIHAIETYFPQTYVSQAELEHFDGASKGKYTIGLGQKNMAFVEPYEDVNSLALTVVQNTLEKYRINPQWIGRLEVGTETLIDKSKSTKTVLMQLFARYGNHDIEGITSVNACYGGTAALFNTLAWVESSAYDGKRLGCVVTVDIAVYKKGNARPSGGAGAVCMIIGPNAPFVVEPIRSTFIDHAYDFYKPDPRSEFPTVDGHFSISTYLGAIDNNYKTINAKYEKASLPSFSLDRIAYGCFHAPFAKMVQKAFTRLFYNELIHGNVSGVTPTEIETLRSQDFASKPVQEILARLSKDTWNKKVKPSLFMGENLGNIYTGSLYSGLCSLINNQDIDLQGKRILMFSYGSGLASSMFVLRVDSDYSRMKAVLNLEERLAMRTKISVEEYDQIMAVRERTFGSLPAPPQVNFDRLLPGSFYLKSIDSMWRRSYDRVPLQTETFHSRSQQVQANPCSSQSTDITNDSYQQQQQQLPFGKVLIIDDADFNTQRTRLTNRLQQFRKQMSTASSASKSRAESNGQSPNKKRSHSSDKTLNAKLWAGFYKKTLRERLDQIQKIDPSIETTKFMDGGLTLERAELMVENCVGKISIPLGLGLNFKINGKYFTVPMATEEPSVIAAASSAAKFIDENGGGLITYSTRPIMIGQIQLLEVDPITVSYRIDQNKDKLIAYANEICPNMVARGGGVKDIKVRILDAREKCLKSTGEYSVDSMVVIDFLVNVCDSMGANMINTILEYVAPMVETITAGRVGLKILSNLCTERRAVAEFEIPVAKMGWKDANGETVAKKMIEGYRFAQLDPYRASTHNKGIFNGMDAVAIATGQDWRSIESSCHTYASIANPRAGYQPLTHYELVKSKKTNEFVMHGVIEIPISVGSQGGVLNSNALYNTNMRLLGFPNAQQLSEIIAAVGLCQNFGALRALAVEGIQKGHMNLHAKNIAISGGVPTHLVEEATRFMKSRSKMNVDTAKAYLTAHNFFEEVRQCEERESSKQIAVKQQPLSTFFIELDCEALDEPIVLHVALDCLVGADKQPIHLAIEPAIQSKKTPQDVQEIQDLLFGQKGYEWLRQIFAALEVVNLNMEAQKGTAAATNQLPIRRIVYKLKLVAIIINLLTGNILAIDAERSVPIINQLIGCLSKQDKSQLKNLNIVELLPAMNTSSAPLDATKETALKFGLSLLGECLRIFDYNIDSSKLADEELKSALLNELQTVLSSIVQSHLEWRKLVANSSYAVDGFSFVELRQKRLCATMMLLCDCVHIGVGADPMSTLSVIRQLGSVYELEMTLSRDLKRWNPNNMCKEVNLYSHWLLSHRIADGTQPEIRQAFIAEIVSILNAKKLQLHPNLDEKLRVLCDFTSQVIRSYYQFNEPSTHCMKPSL